MHFVSKVRNGIMYMYVWMVLYLDGLFKHEYQNPIQTVTYVLVKLK